MKQAAGEFKAGVLQAVQEIRLLPVFLGLVFLTSLGIGVARGAIHLTYADVMVLVWSVFCFGSGLILGGMAAPYGNERSRRKNQSARDWPFDQIGTLIHVARDAIKPSDRKGPLPARRLVVRVSPGVFQSERIVSFEVNSKSYSLILDEEEINEGTILVYLVNQGGDDALVDLPTETFDSGKRIRVPLTILLPA
jgi:hypothetical protein